MSQTLGGGGFFLTHTVYLLMFKITVKKPRLVTTLTVSEQTLFVYCVSIDK